MTKEIDNDELTPEQVSEQSKKDWADMAGEVFGTDSVDPINDDTQSEESAPENNETPEAKEKEIAPENEGDDANRQENLDPWDGVPEIVKNQFVELSQKVSDKDALEHRLKQAERRIGSLTNELSAAKKAASDKSLEKDEKPTQKEIRDASKDSEKWKSLREEFPDWAGAMDERLDAERNAISEQLAEMRKLVSQLNDSASNANPQQANAGPTAEEIDARLARQKEEMQLTMAHPTWQQDIDGNEYKAWIMVAPDDIKKKASSIYASDAIDVLNKFYEHKNARTKTPEEIKNERQKRLSSSQSTKTEKHKPRVAKPESEMTDKELWNHMAKKVWG